MKKLTSYAVRLIDETSSDVDNLLHIIESDHVLLTWINVKNEPQYKHNLKALIFLNKAQMQKVVIKITKLHQLTSLFMTKSEAENREKSSRFPNRNERFRMPAS